MSAGIPERMDLYRMRADIIGAFEVPGEDDNGRRLVEFCDETGLCMGNTHFEHESLY